MLNGCNESQNCLKAYNDVPVLIVKSGEEALAHARLYEFIS